MERDERKWIRDRPGYQFRHWNPLDNIANTRKINKVYLRGQEVDRAGLKAKWQAQWSRKTG